MDPDAESGKGKMDKDESKMEDANGQTHKVLQQMREKKLTDSMVSLSLAAPDDKVSVAYICETEEKSGYIAPPPVPDGGWGWVVVAASFFGTGLLGVSFSAFSILYVEWVQYFGSDSGETGWIGSLFSGSGNILSVLFSVLADLYGCRVVAISGGLLTAFGFFLSSFATNVFFLYFSYGILSGIGTGMLFLSCAVIVQQYFNKRRAIAAGISIAGLSVGSLISGPLFQFLIDYYGWRGAMLINSGMALHFVIFGALFRPVSQYFPRSYKADINANSQKDDTSPSSIKTSCSRILKAFSKLLCDFTIFRNKLYILYVIGMSGMAIGLLPLILHAPSRAVFYGASRQQVALLPTYGGIATLVAKLIFGFVANLKCTNRLLQFGIGTIFAGCTVVLSTIGTTFLTITLFFCLFTFVNGIIFSVQTTSLVDLVGIKLFPRAQAYAMMIIGIGSLVSVPMAGYLLDVTGSYEVPFYVTGTIQIMGGIILTAIVPLQLRLKRNLQE